MKINIEMYKNASILEVLFYPKVLKDTCTHEAKFDWNLLIHDIQKIWGAFFKSEVDKQILVADLKLKTSPDA